MPHAAGRLAGAGGAGSLGTSGGRRDARPRPLALRRELGAAWQRVWGVARRPHRVPAVSPPRPPAACLHFGEGCEANMRWPQTLGPMVLFGIVIIKFRLFSFQNALEKSNHFANQNKHFQLIL